MAEYIEREAALRTAHIMRPEDKCLETELMKIPAADVAPVGWISVKDKLPEPEQDVLVIAHGWSGRLLYIGSYQRMEAETSWLTGVTSKASDWLLWGWSYLREPEVTHWMPLPEPPTSARMDGGADNETD
jgi:hypothetical protein